MRARVQGPILLTAPRSDESHGACQPTFPLQALQQGLLLERQADSAHERGPLQDQALRVQGGQLQRRVRQLQREEEARETATQFGHQAEARVPGRKRPLRSKRSRRFRRKRSIHMTTEK